MLNTYIKNKGITQTILHNNNRNHINEINWEADYDGDLANIYVDTNKDGKRKHFDISLNNEDLANILNIESVNMPIEQRLQYDFNDQNYVKEPFYIELPEPESEHRRKPIFIKDKLSSHAFDNLLSNNLLSKHISSPLSNEEFLVPLTIDKNTIGKYTLTPRRTHKKPKTHVTHRVYKKYKSNSRRSSRRSKSSRSRRSSRSSRSSR
jgi:hypothetical protein